MNTEPIKVEPVNFEEWSGASIRVKHAIKGDDLIIQVTPNDKLPPFAGERVVKAMLDTVGEASMEKIYIDVINSEFIESGAGVFIRCSGMGSDVHKNIMFPKLHQLLDEYMQAP